MNKRSCDICNKIFDEERLDMVNDKWVCNDCEQEDWCEDEI